MFEAEIKYTASSGFSLTGLLPFQKTVSVDVYFDSPDGSFYASGRELRLRTTGGKTILTYKEPPFDAATASKEEFETVVADGEAMHNLLRGLGYVPRMTFGKTCRLHHHTVHGLALAVTVVTVDFDPRTFVEIEHLAATRQAGLDALPHIRAYATHLGLTQPCATAYTDLFLANRGEQRRPQPSEEMP